MKDRPTVPTVEKERLSRFVPDAFAEENVDVAHRPSSIHIDFSLPSAKAPAVSFHSSSRLPRQNSIVKAWLRISRCGEEGVED